MGVHVAEQTMVFLQSIAIGMMLGLLFDAFRISRLALPTSAVVVFIEDLLYFAVCAMVTFALLMGAVEGQLRFFLLIGEGLGAILYFLTLGRLVMAVSKTIIRVIGAILHFFYRWLLRPVYRLVYFLVAFLLKPFYLIGGTAKKTMQRCRFPLKVRRILVYNHFKMRFRKNNESRSGEQGPYEESQSQEKT